jgi:5'-nucleotidase (lipoprotein e(P4) family)
MNPKARTLSTLVALALVGCASAGSVRAPVGPGPGEPGGAFVLAAPAAHPVPAGIHWYRTAAEQRALYEQAYWWAAERVRLTAPRQSGPWGVILDADETVLDNSTYQLRRAEQGLGYTPESWNDWVREEAAPALPGAVAFIRGVKELGGRVAIVTNRDESVCDPTRRNLVAAGVDADVVLCRRPGPSSKEARFRAVADGTAARGLPALAVVAWVGDNIQDFPGGSQAWRTDPGPALADFGTRYFILPNPMYGSWESNPGR